MIPHYHIFDFRHDDQNPLHKEENFFRSLHMDDFLESLRILFDSSFESDF